MSSWPVIDAKNRFSELIEEAHVKGPQIITKHGNDRAVVISMAEYRSLTAHKPNLKEYLLGGPKVDDFVFERDIDMGRTIDFSDQ